MSLRKKLRFTAAVMLVLALFITGCSKKTGDSKTDTKDTTSTQTDSTVKEENDSKDDTKESSELEPMIIEVYSQAANFQGE